MNTFLLSIRDFFKRVGHFIKNVFKLFKIAFSDKLKYNVVDESLNGHWFDYGYLYNIELAKLIEMRDAFKEKGISVDNEKYVRQMDLAIKLLRIVIEDDCFHFEHYPDEHGKIVFENYIDESGKMVSVSNMKYVCDVKVNLKNAKRFVKDEEVMDFYTERYPHELYLLKAQYLYHKLRFYFEQYWWD